ncbi:MAG: hypothetical protein EA403_01030 [Spirochaetaceae bacterium]|nr:MAG: hypothetical protein EA403_01030 [Spirochaetaceae bacterium]
MSASRVAGRPSSHPWRPALVAVVMLAALLYAPASGAAQVVGYDWAFEVNHRSARAGDGSGGIFSAIDQASLSLAVAQQLDRGLLTYRAAFGVAYSAQRQFGFVAREDGLVLYPGRTGVELLLIPDHMQGAWITGELGRIALHEPSDLLFTNRDALEYRQLADGFSLGLRWPRTRVQLAAASLRLVADPINGLTAAGSEGELLGPVVLIGYVARTPLAGRQDTALVVISTIDQPAPTGRTDSVAGGVVVNGPIRERLTHRTTAYGAWVNAAGEDDAGFAALIETRLLYRTSTRWLEELWGRSLYAGGMNGNTRFPATAGAPLAAVYAEPPSDAVVGEVGAATTIALGDRGGLVRPELALRVIGVPSGRAGERTGIEPDGRFLGVELHPAVAVIPIDGVELSAEAALLFSNVPARSVLRFHGRVRL